MKNLLLEMVAVPSISGTFQEKEMSRKVTEILRRMDYFQTHPHLIFEKELQDDPLGRSYVAALMRGGGGSGRTIILLNHFDVVDTADYGDLADLAFSPLPLAAALDKLTLAPSVRQDLKAGSYLFGRGTADMKAGTALQLAVLQHLSRAEEGFRGNLLFLSLPDEEGSSRGALEALPFLSRLGEQFNLTYEAVINCEPAFPDYPGDEGRYIYTGSMGKVIAMFYCYGREAHAGEPMSGLNGHRLAAEICRLLEGNTDFCESLGTVTTPPPSCLKHLDFKRLYSVQIPHNAASYYNLFLLNENPRELLYRLKGLAFQAFENVLSRLNEEREKFSLRKKTPFSPVEWQPSVYTYQEFCRQFLSGEEKFPKEEAGDPEGRMDPRERALRLVDRVHGLGRESSPKIIVGFLPPYYPSVTVTGRNAREERLLATVKEVVQLARLQGLEIKCCPSFPGLSDLSFFNLHSGEGLMSSLADNMPGYGKLYHLPLEDIGSLQVPVVNISTSGKDVHKYTERVDLTYSFDVLPPLILQAIQSILS